MTTVTFFFLTLFICMLSSGTWLRLDQRTELRHCGHGEERKGFISNASNKKAAIYEQIKLTFRCERSPEMSIALERILKQDKIKKDFTLLPCVTLNYKLINGCVSLWQRFKETVNEEQNNHVCKCRVKITSDNHSIHLNHRIHPSFVLLRSLSHCSHIFFINLAVKDHWRIMDCSCICEACNLEVKILPGFLWGELGPVFPELLLHNLSEGQESLMSSMESKKKTVRTCFVQMPLKFYLQHFPKETFLTQSGREESVRPADDSRWVPRCFLTVVLLLGIYMSRLKSSPNGVSPARGGDSSLVMLFTMTWQRLSSSVTIHQHFDWSPVSIRISLILCFSSAVGRTIHVLIVYRSTHTFIKLFCTTRQQFGALPFTVLHIWLISRPPCPCKSIKHWFEDILDDTVGSILRPWAVLGQIELLLILYSVFVLLPSVLKSILNKLKFLSVLLNMQLIACL